MSNGPESPIMIGEGFTIKQFAKPDVPIFTCVKAVENFDSWQRFLLTPVHGNKTDFHVSTRRRLELGVFTDRRNSRLFLRAAVLGSRTLDFFDNSQLVEEAIMHLQEQAISRIIGLNGGQNGNGIPSIMKYL